MAGCMVGSSLAMAPATLIARGANIVDPDGPLLLGEERGLPLKLMKREFIRRYKNSGDNRKEIIVQKKFIKPVGR